MLLLLEGRIFAEAVPPGEFLFPDTTRGFIAITKFDTLSENYNKTQLGKLTADPKMEAFTKDVRRQFEIRWSAVHARLGLTLDDLKEVSSGEVCVGLIEPVENTSALAIVIDATRETGQGPRTDGPGKKESYGPGRQANCFESGGMSRSGDSIRDAHSPGGARGRGQQITWGSAD